MPQNIMTPNRFPTDGRQLSAEEVAYWYRKIKGSAREMRFIAPGGDGFVYLLFQDRAGGLADMEPVCGRIPAKGLADFIAQMIHMGLQIQVAPEPPKLMDAADQTGAGDRTDRRPG